MENNIYFQKINELCLKTSLTLEKENCSVTEIKFDK
jgi:hypothetical protein